MSHPSVSRRRFLAQAASCSALGAAVPFGLNMGAITRAAAQSASGYKALVCVFLAGGNDAFNTVLATDTTSWNHYLKHRRPVDGSTSIALMEAGVAPNASAAAGTPARQGGVLPIAHGNRAVHSGRTFALHPSLSRLQQQHANGTAAVVANVGPLTRPTTKADWISPSASKPRKLFSHNDQQSTWQTFQTEGASAGWGGLMGDRLMSRNGVGRSQEEMRVIQRMFTCMSPMGAATWLAGQSVLPYQSSMTAVPGLGASGQVYGSATLRSALVNVMSQQAAASQANILVADHQDVVKRALLASDMLGSRLAALGASPWSTSGVTNAYNDPLLKYTSPNDGSQKFNTLALQLQMVARLIATSQSSALNLNRQFFMVSLGGFDFHDRQVQDQAERLAMLDHALAYFDQVLRNMPSGDLSNQVTTFTASEFGRTFTSNGDGTDHGWGGHQFVVGGAVRGTEVYGTFPTYSSADAQGAFGSPDQINNGILIPTTSVDHLAYTLGRWMDVSHSDLMGFLPNLAQFNSAGHDLGFMRT
jgi:uncharacterized protein (DUF1501 family)